MDRRHVHVFFGGFFSLVVVARLAIGGDAPEHDAANALKGLKVHPDLEVTLFASEPMIVNPTNVEVDERGRVWICEVVNYRRINRPAGDRIVVVEDSDGDGAADRSTVFYESPDINGAQGLCVLGARVIVACSPNVFVLSDDDGDDRADRRELLFTNLGPEHDHSAHASVLGPDGKLYWNFGNTGGHVYDKSGKQVVDLAGHPVADGGKPYWGGMVFRCNVDGSDLEVVGHNFRNNYEATVDSFGTIWQSDNDDDGNRGVRLNYVMEFGNFGYLDEVTGERWKTKRTGMHRKIPKRHWHQNDPGVVPNLVHTGNGSPTGICVYEGRLLPAVFRGQIINCDARPGVVRACPVKSDGAGYRADIVPILSGKKESWFRPSDVCVAPDGSLFVTDWYDPVVGGHNMADPGRGRIFRVAPPGTPYRVPQFSLSTVEGAIETLKNPNRKAQYRARTALREFGSKAEGALRQLFHSGTSRSRARALWLLSELDGRGSEYVRNASKDDDPNIRIAALRAMRKLGSGVHELVRGLLRDPSPAVRRECAIALRNDGSGEVPKMWAVLAEQHDGADRWYLEALGIGAHGRWNSCFDAWLERVGDDWNSPAGRDVIWRSRAAKTPEYLEKIIAAPGTKAKDLSRYFRAFDFQSGDRKTEVLSRLAFNDQEGKARRVEFILMESLTRLRGTSAVNDPRFEPALDAMLDRVKGTERFVDLVGDFAYAKRYSDLLELSISSADSQVGIAAARALVESAQLGLFEDTVASPDLDRAATAVRVLGNAADARTFDFLLDLVRDESRTLEIRRQATRALARMFKGAVRLVEMIEKDELDERLHIAAAFQLRRAPWREVITTVARLFPSPPTKNDAPLPPISVLLKMRGNVQNGRRVYEREDSCIRCHVVSETGKAVGPELSEIGEKLSAPALYESILYPSAGISHNYETWSVALKDGDVLTGLIVDETPEAISIKAADAIVRSVKTSAVIARSRQPVSLMPADLQKQMTTVELVDLVAYLGTLQKKK